MQLIQIKLKLYHENIQLLPYIYNCYITHPKFERGSTEGRSPPQELEVSPQAGCTF